MFYSDYVKSNMKIRSVWFSEDVNISLHTKVDFVYYHHIKSNEMISDSFSSLETDLTLDENDILAKMSKTCRYEVRRAEKDGLIINEEMSISEFHQYYNEFALKKNIKQSDMKTLLAYEKFSFISAIKLDDKVLSAHLYVLDDSVARLLYSANILSETTDSNVKAIIGRGNRYLHWHDIKKLKNKNIKKYDWGGYSEDGPTSSIGKFKKSFGGYHVDCFNYIVPISLKGKSAFHVMKLFKKI